MGDEGSRRTVSIPGRWEAVSLNTTPVKKGFGTCSARFKSDITDVPGPGAYSKVEGQLIKKTPSLSKKGFGNAFVSKTNKIIPEPDSMTPGPGAYDIKGIDHVVMKPTPAFVKSGRGRVPYPDPALTKKYIPGPLDYSPVVTSDLNPPLLVRKSSASFISASGRQSFLARNNGVPGAGKYRSETSGVKPVPTFFWSRSTYKRFQSMGMDNKVPGPGAYFDERNRKKTERESLESNGRSSGVYREVQWLGKQNDDPVEALHTFGADKDRFKHSFMGRLDLKAEIPGVGSYDLPSFSLKKKRPATSAEHIPPFNSSGPRILSSEKSGVPGPAYYKPQTPKNPVIKQNLDQHWV